MKWLNVLHDWSESVCDIVLKVLDIIVVAVFVIVTFLVSVAAVCYVVKYIVGL